MIAERDADLAVEALAAVPYFQELDRHMLEPIARSTVRHVYEAGEVIFLEGDPLYGLGILQEGWVKAIKLSSAGREQVLHVLGPGEVFNAIGVFLGTPCPSTIIALERATVWIIEPGALVALLDRHPHLAHRTIRHLARRVQHLVGLVEDLSLRSVEARVARWVLDRSQGNILPRRRWTTQAQLASQLGTVLDVLNRTLRQLVEQGLIRVERHQIEILDRESLEAKTIVDI